MGSGLPVLVGLWASALLWCALVSGFTAGRAAALVVSAVFAVGTYFGLTPRWAQSVLAHALHLVPDVVFRLTGNRPFNFTSIDDTIVLGRMPRGPDDLRALVQNEDVGAVIVMNESWEQCLPIGHYFREGVDVMVLQTPDYSAPDIDAVMKALNFIEDVRSRDSERRRTYLHCNGGKGRSGVVAIAWVMATQGVPLEVAFGVVAGKRKIANMPRWGGILPQWRALREVEARLLMSGRIASL